MTPSDTIIDHCLPVQNGSAGIDSFQNVFAWNQIPDWIFKGFEGAQVTELCTGEHHSSQDIWGSGYILIKPCLHWWQHLRRGATVRWIVSVSISALDIQGKMERIDQGIWQQICESLKLDSVIFNHSCLAKVEGRQVLWAPSQKQNYNNNRKTAHRQGVTFKRKRGFSSLGGKKFGHLKTILGMGRIAYLCNAWMLWCFPMDSAIPEPPESHYVQTWL